VSSEARKRPVITKRRWRLWFTGLETGKVVMTGEASLWLQNLKALGQSQGYLTYAQFNEGLPLSIVDPEEIEVIVEQLKRSGIRVVPDSPAVGS